MARQYNYSQNALNQLLSITQPDTAPGAANYGLGTCADASMTADLSSSYTGPTIAMPAAGTAGTATTGGTQSPKYTFTHDNEGRMTAKGTQAYVYDALNRMTQVTGKETYLYDGHGRRVQITKTTDGKQNFPIYSLDGKLLQEDNRQTLQRIEYIHVGGRLVAKRIQPITAAGAKNGTATTTTIHTDFLGSPVAETDSAGTVTRVERYTPYGEAVDLALDAGPGFTGHATDVATGLTYMQQRYYDADIGRFISPDPVGPEEDFVNHFNRYNYALNNPVRYTDPDGREIVIPWGSIGEIASKRGTQAAVASQVDSPAPGPGDVVGAIILLGALFEVGHTIYVANTANGEVENRIRDLVGNKPKTEDVIALGDKGWEWRGAPGSEVGGDKGSFNNTETGEQIHNDLDSHKAGSKKGPHITYTDSDGNSYDYYPDSEELVELEK